MSRPEKDAGTDYLRQHDDKSTARERGYSHGELPGGPLHFDDWSNVPNPGPSVTSEFGGLSDPELDEERRGDGALSDERPDGDVTVTFRFRGIPPRSWLAGWDAEAMARYLVHPERSNGVWNDQAWRRYWARKQRTLPPQRGCAVCSEVFQPERKTALYCSNACRQRAKRARDTLTAAVQG